MIATRGPSLPLNPEHVIRFDGSLRTAVRAFLNAGERPVLFIVDSADTNALATIGRARAAGVRTEALVHCSSLGPLGRTVLSSLASSLVQHTNTGIVLAALREFERRTRTFVIVDSPAKLQRPTPSLWQHVRGLLPGTCFVGELSGRVTAVGRRGLPRPLVDSLHSPSSTLHTTVPHEVGAHRADVWSRVISAASPWNQVPHPPDNGAAAWWGPSLPLELCAVPADIASIITTVHEQATQCPWCGHAAVSDACAVCGSSVLHSMESSRHRVGAISRGHSTGEGR